MYVDYALAPISPMLLVYISVDRFIAIKYPSRRFMIRNERNQFIYFMVVFVFNVVYYLPYAFENCVIRMTRNATNQTADLQCGFSDMTAQTILNWMDTFNSVLMPFTLTFLLTCLIIYTIFRSRARTRSANLTENRNRSSDIKFSITCLALNIILLVLNPPCSVVNFFPVDYSGTLYLSIYYLFFFSYAVIFYILLATNSLVRGEFCGQTTYNV